MIEPACLKAGIYFTHNECFGHTSRVIAIAQAFKKKFPRGSFFFIQAGMSQPMAQLSQYGPVYLLPNPYTNRRIFRGDIPRPGPDAVLRAKACEAILNKERPDIFITEFFPMGREECRHELIPSLLKASAKGVKLWAVTGYPLLLGKGLGWRDKIIKHYQKIIIFAPAMEKDRMEASMPESDVKERYKDFFRSNKEKIIFAGYMLPQGGIIKYDDVNVYKPSVLKRVCRVAVLRGGGAYYPKIIAESIRTSDLLGQGYYFTIIAGPSTTPDEWHLFANLLTKKNVKNAVLLKAITDYEGLIKDSDVCVSTASYHTAVMLMKHRKKAVLIPFEGHGKEALFSEQPARAALLQDIIHAGIVSIKDLTAAGLAASIKKSRRSRPEKRVIPKDWFCGTDFLSKALEDYSRIIS